MPRPPAIRVPTEAWSSRSFRRRPRELAADRAVLEVEVDTPSIDNSVAEWHRVYIVTGG
jgi:hypothetical protein